MERAELNAMLLCLQIYKFDLSMLLMCGLTSFDLIREQDYLCAWVCLSVS